MSEAARGATVADLDDLPLFERFDAGARQAAARCLALRPHAAGEVLFRAGDVEASVLRIVARGRVELAGEGRSQTAGPGTLAGLSSYLDGGPHTATARALDDGAVLLLTRPLGALQQDCPELYRAVNREMAGRIRREAVRPAREGRGLAVPARGAMRAPLATCAPGTSLREAFAVMDARRIGSLLVVYPDDRLAGVLTYAGLARAVLEQGAAPEDDVMRVACERPFTVAPDTPLWEVEQIQQTHGLKYVIVASGGYPLGMISQTDIVRALFAAGRAAPAEIAGAPDFATLRGVREALPERAAAAREANRRATAANQAINDDHLAIQRRSIELTLAELEEAGQGAPPMAYAFVIMGSGGRGEMLLAPDQDNGLILAAAPDQAARRWFQELAERVNTRLDEVGYILCPGEIMARAPLFHKTLEEWRLQITRVTEHPTPKAARWANVALDFDLLYGQRSLVEDLRRHALAELRARPRLLALMVEDDAEGRPPLGLFNRLLTEKQDERRGKIDLKRNALRILADGARIYALRAGVDSRGTQERLTGAVRQGLLDAEYAESVKAAHEALTALLLDHQLRQAARGAPVDKLLTVSTRTPMEQETLRMALRVVKDFQDKLQADFGTLVF